MIAFRNPLHFGSRVRDGDETRSRLIGTDCLLRDLKEVLLEDVGFKGSAGLARNNKSVFAGSILFSIVLICAGSVESSTCSCGKPGILAIGQSKDVWTQTRSAHAKQQDVGKLAVLGIVGYGFQVCAVRDLFVGDAEPSEPVCLVGSGPERGVVFPQASNFSIGTPVIEVFFYEAARSVGRV